MELLGIIRKKVEEFWKKYGSIRKKVEVLGT